MVPTLHLGAAGDTYRHEHLTNQFLRTECPTDFFFFSYGKKKKIFFSLKRESVSESPQVISVNVNYFRNGELS